jgi:hypothetical protein
MTLPPSVANPNIIVNFTKYIIPWTADDEIPTRGPEIYILKQNSCIVTKDFSNIATRCHFKKEMQRHWIGEGNDRKVKIFIRGVTGSWQDRI